MVLPHAPPTPAEAPVLDRSGPRLIDPHRRWIHKLRVQLTDACNFRCFYCMPENATFAPPNALLSSDEIITIVSRLVDHGIDEVRLTGGEPTLRRDLEQIVHGLSTLPLAKFGITTNGYLLAKKLPLLWNARCHHINISLDSLDSERYRQINRRDAFAKVYETMMKTIAMGFKVKVNVVVFRGINDAEIHDFVRFSREHQVEVRFLEYMRIGLGNTSLAKHFMPMREIIERIEEREKLYHLPGSVDATAQIYGTESGARVGFIASESQPFCSGCSRLRLTAKGTLRACIMSQAGLNLRGVPGENYPDVLKSVMALKPSGRIESLNQAMHEIGG